MPFSAPDDSDTDRTQPRHAPFDEAASGPAPEVALPPGARLHERFELLDVAGQGGFGIVYRAWDEKLHREVAIKEYMPAAFAARGEDMAVRVRSDRFRELFQQGLESFIGEARMLAEFDHPALIKVFDFMQVNGSAYMVMPFYRGETLRQAMDKRPAQAVTEDWISDLLRDIFGALRVLHARHCFHRDIAPDNILLLSNGRPLLLDFGAARRVFEGETRDLTVILKPGYAPIEQYDSRSSQLGAWTDIYSLGAVLYWLVTGRPPPASVARLERDDIPQLATSGDTRFRTSFLAGIDRALALRAKDRPQTIDEFAQALGIDGPDQRLRDGSTDSERGRPNAPAERTSRRWLGYLVGALFLVGIALGSYIGLMGLGRQTPTDPALPVAGPAEPERVPAAAGHATSQPPAEPQSPVASPAPERVPQSERTDSPTAGADPSAPVRQSHRAGSENASTPPPTVPMKSAEKSQRAESSSKTRNPEYCRSLLERATLGEPLTSEERASLRTCR